MSSLGPGCCPARRLCWGVFDVVDVMVRGRSDGASRRRAESERPRRARRADPSPVVGREARVRVQRVLSPGGAESWTVIGDDLRPVAPVESYLAWLSRIERSPNTVRAYAHDLKVYWAFLDGARAARGIASSLEQLGEFMAWLRQPADNVVVLATGRARAGASTVNRMLSAVIGLLRVPRAQRRRVARALVDRDAFGPRQLQAVSARDRAGQAARAGRAVARAAPAAADADARAGRGGHRRAAAAARPVLVRAAGADGDAVGQALGLRHCDFVAHERRIEIVRARGQRQRRARQGRAGVGADHRRAGALLLGLHARGVRRAGLRLRVREPVGRPDRARR